MSNNNQVSFSDLFDFNDRTPVDKGIQVIEALEKSYAGMVDSLTSRSKEAEAALKGFTGTLQKLKEANKPGASDSAISDNAKASAALRKEMEALKKSQSDYQKTIDTLNKQLDKLKDSKDALSDKNTLEAGSLAKLKKQLKEAQTQYELLGKATDDATKTDALKKLTEINNEYKKQKKILDDAKKAKSDITKSYKSEAGSLDSLKQRLKEAEAHYLSLGKASGEIVKSDALKKFTELNNEYKKQKAILDEAKKAKIEISKANDVESGSLVDLKRQLKEAEEAYRKLTISGNKNSEADPVSQEQLNKITELGVAVKKGEKAMRDAKNGVVVVTGSYNALAQEVNELNQDLKNLPEAWGKNKAQAEALQRVIYKKTQTLKDFDAAVNQNFRDVGKYQLALQGLGTTFKDALGFGSALAVFATISTAFKSAIETNKEFEKSLSSLSSITGATGQDLEYYKEQAAEIGQTTTLSASQAVEAFKLMGSAAPELLKNREALAATTREAVILAEAAGIELPAATQALASAMNQFNLPASEANRLINALAAGSKVGAAEIPDLTAAMDKAGNTAKGFNVSVEESVAAIEVLSKANIKGAEAGTALRNVLLTMQTIDTLPPKAQAKLEEYGVSLEKVSDTTIPLQERMEELAKVTGDASAMKEIFGKENINAGAAILQNTKLLAEYTEGVTGTSTALDQATTNVDNLDGDLKSLSSVMESLVLEGSTLNGLMRSLVQGFTAFLLAIKETPRFIKENIGLISALGVAIIAYNTAQINANALKLKDIALAKKKIIWDKAQAVATRLTTTSQWNLNAALSANPIGAVIVAVAALAAVFVTLYNRSETLRAGVAGLWESLKVVGENISEVFDVLTIDNLTKGLVTGDFSAITGAFKKMGEGAGTAFADGYNTKLKEEHDKLEAERIKNNNALVDRNQKLRKSELEKELSFLRRKKSLLKEGSEEEKDLIEKINKKKQEITDAESNYQKILVDRKKNELEREKKLIDEKLLAVEKGSEEEINLLIARNEKIKEINELGAKINVAGWQVDGKTDDEIEAERKAAEEKAKINEEYAKKVREATRELNKIRLEEEIATNKAIAEDEKRTQTERLMAVRDVTEAEIGLQKIAREAALDNTGLIKEEVEVIEEKFRIASANIEKEMHKALNSIAGDFQNISREAKTFDDLLAAIGEKAKGIKFNAFQDNETGYTKVLAELEKSLGRGEVNLKEFHSLQLQAEQNFLKSRLDLLKAQKAPLKEIYQAELELQRSYNKQRQLEGEMSWGQYLQLSVDIANKIAGMTAALGARKADQYNEEVAALEAAKERELQILSDDKEAQMAIEEQFALKKKKLDEEEAKRRRKQAVFEKAIAVTQTIIDTAKGVTAALPNIPLSIAIGIMGAAQLATIVAQPIPQYAKGTDNAPEGWAIVDEEGPEILERKGKRYIGQDKGPRLTYLEKGDKVIPNNKVQDILMKEPANRMVSDVHKTMQLGSQKLQEIAPKPLSRSDINQVFELNNMKLIQEVNSLKMALINKPTSHINLDEKGLQQWIQAGQNRTYYRNRKRL